MVTQKEQRRRRKEFSLERIKELAGRGSVMHGSTRVSRHITDLGYSPDEVCDCLASLEEEHYRGSVNYGDHKGWLDEYLITWSAADGKKSDLYIKLKLNRDCVTIVLASFHREGAL